MTQIRRLLPDPGMIDAQSLNLRRLRPFSPAALEFGQALSESLLADPHARGRAEIVAAAFALRRAAGQAFCRRVRAQIPPGCRAAPRGTVLLMAPANVDSLFLHCWFIALLCGCAAMIRVSGRPSPVRGLLLDHIGRILAEPRFAEMQDSVAFLTWDHDDGITGALSAQCDLRMVWGGDATIAAIRRLPLPPRAAERCFADRVSAAAISAAAYLACGPDRRDGAIRDFCNDSFGFDQSACSSPRLLVWVGGAEECAAARADFLPRLGAASPRQADGVAMAKTTEAARLILDGRAIALHRWGGATLVDCSAAIAPATGGGMFAVLAVTDLLDLADMLDGRWQTLCHFGIPAAQLQALAQTLNGRALDRFVPWGKALEFDAIWDGGDLAWDFLRLTNGL